MQEGSLRVDANVSVRRPGGPLGTRCEVKNLNSMRFLQRAIAFEAARQVAVLEAGGSVRQETRLFDAVRGETRSMRSKGEAHDYGTVSGRIAKDVFAEMFETGRPAAAIVEEKGLKQVTDAAAIEVAIDEALAQHADKAAVERWPSGRRRSPAKGVWVKSPSRVRIPSSPPYCFVKRLIWLRFSWKPSSPPSGGRGKGCARRHPGWRCR